MRFLSLLLAVVLLLFVTNIATAQLFNRSNNVSVNVGGGGGGGVIQPQQVVAYRPYRPLLRAATAPLRAARIVVAPQRLVTYAQPARLQVNLGHNAYVQSQLISRQRLQLNQINTYGTLPMNTSANIVYRHQAITYVPQQEIQQILVAPVMQPQQVYAQTQQVQMQTVTLPATQPSCYASGAQSIVVPQYVTRQAVTVCPQQLVQPQQLIVPQAQTAPPCSKPQGVTAPGGCSRVVVPSGSTAPSGFVPY